MTKFQLLNEQGNLYAVTKKKNQFILVDAPTPNVLSLHIQHTPFINLCHTLNWFTHCVINFLV